MDRSHFVIIMCQHCAHCKACKLDLGPNLFLLDFCPPNHAKTHLELKLESGISINNVNIFKMNPFFLTRIESQCLNKSKED